MKTFGEIITEKMYNQGLTLRSLWKKLEASGSGLTTSKLSKIMRGIQNPKDQTEFNELMQALGIVDATELQDLETLAMTFIAPQTLTDDDFGQSLPMMPPRHFKDEAELDEFLKSWRDIMEKDKEPDLK